MSFLSRSELLSILDSLLTDDISSMNSGSPVKSERGPLKVSPLTENGVHFQGEEQPNELAGVLEGR